MDETSPVADIFISYASNDRQLAAALAAFLEAEGWSVWWDKSLNPGDIYRDEIMKQLAAARAVIVIWTAHSIKSDWVRAEAGRAQADRKLIPVKQRTIGYSDIPLPFGEMHTVDLEDTPLIRASVVSVLAKPAVEAKPLDLGLKIFHLQILTWMGIVGGSITLFSSLRGLFDLADWVRWLVTQWHFWSRYVWTLLLERLGLHVSERIVPLLSFALFIVIIAVGVRLKTRIDRKNGQETSRAEDFRRSVPRLLKWVALYLICLCALYYALPKYDPAASIQLTLARIALLLAWIAPYVLLISLSEDRMQVALTSSLMIICYVMIVYIPATTLNREMPYFLPVVGWKAIALYFIPFISVMWIVSFVPPQSINRRLSFLLIGVILLFSLNEMSQLELRRYLLG
jgi:hypothetical protein